jgi:hypothetical protein
MRKRRLGPDHPFYDIFTDYIKQMADEALKLNSIDTNEEYKT